MGLKSLTSVAGSSARCDLWAAAEGGGGGKQSQLWLHQSPPRCCLPLSGDEPTFQGHHFFKRQVTKQATPCYLEEWPPLCLLRHSDSKAVGCDQCTICQHQEQSHQDCREVHSAPGHHADPDLTVSGPQMWGSGACRAPRSDSSRPLSDPRSPGWANFNGVTGFPDAYCASHVTCISPS